jgi:hypothetical protein
MKVWDESVEKYETSHQAAVTPGTWKDGDRIQRAAAMRVTRVATASGSGSSKATSGEQTSPASSVNSLFCSRTYADFITDVELQQAKAEVEECYRRRAWRAGMGDMLPVGRPMMEEELEDLQWQPGDFGPAGGYGSRGTKRRKDLIEMTIEEMEAELEETKEAIRKRQRGNLGLMLKPLWMLTIIACMVGEPATAFTAYDCSDWSNVVESYSLLEPDACANSGKDREVETTVYGEIVQIKQDRMIPVFRCTVIETLTAQHCGMFSHVGVTRYLKFRELKPMEAWECRKARTSGSILINGHPVDGKLGATVSHTMFLARDLDDKDNCEVGTVTTSDGKTLKGMAAQGLYEITLREEFARMNELTGSLTLTSGVQARATDKSISDSLEGTVVWEYDPMECPQTIVRLYNGMMKAYVNQSSSYEGSSVVIEHQDKDQAAGLEVAESFILCGHHAYRTHIKNIAVFVHEDDRMEVAQGRFSGKEGEADLTRLESGMSFM